jgi:hypothetical protein
MVLDWILNFAPHGLNLEAKAQQVFNPAPLLGS